MGTKYDESLSAKIREKDEVIADLKRMLTEKERRNNDLEQILLWLGCGGIEKMISELHRRPAVGAMDAPSLPRPAAENPAEVGPDRAVLLLDESTGLYEDNWLKPQSSLAIKDAYVGGTVTFTFFLPEIPGRSTKWMKVKPNFADAMDLEVPRGRLFSWTWSIPSGLDYVPRVNIDIPEEPVAGEDTRVLGVVLAAAVKGQPEWAGA